MPTQYTTEENAMKLHVFFEQNRLFRLYKWYKISNI